VRHGQSALAHHAGAYRAQHHAGLAIFLVVLSLNLVGDGLRDALDPRAR
jgi:ABC-type dipeptide/oligopeptide/nickel transport system permease subunit